MWCKKAQNWKEYRLHLQLVRQFLSMDLCGQIQEVERMVRELCLVRAEDGDGLCVITPSRSTVDTLRHYVDREGYMSESQDLALRRIMGRYSSLCRVLNGAEFVIVALSSDLMGGKFEANTAAARLCIDVYATEMGTSAAASVRVRMGRWVDKTVCAAFSSALLSV